MTAALISTLSTSDSTVLATKSIRDKTVSNKSAGNKTVSNKSVSDKIISDKAVIDKTVSNKTVSDTKSSAVHVTWPPLRRICLLLHVCILSLSL